MRLRRIPVARRRQPPPANHCSTRYVHRPEGSSRVLRTLAEQQVRIVWRVGGRPQSRSSLRGIPKRCAGQKLSCPSRHQQESSSRKNTIQFRKAAGQGERLPRCGLRASKRLRDVATGSPAPGRQVNRRAVLRCTADASQLPFQGGASTLQRQSIPAVSRFTPSPWPVGIYPALRTLSRWKRVNCSIPCIRKQGPNRALPRRNSHEAQEVHI